MTTIRYYMNKRNHNKFIEVHNDGYRHNAVKQFMLFQNGVKNDLGDKKLHRCKKTDLDALLDDYEEVNIDDVYKKIAEDPMLINWYTVCNDVAMKCIENLGLMEKFKSDCVSIVEFAKVRLKWSMQKHRDTVVLQSKIA